MNGASTIRLLVSVKKAFIVSGSTLSGRLCSRLISIVWALLPELTSRLAQMMTFLSCVFTVSSSGLKSSIGIVNWNLPSWEVIAGVLSCACAEDSGKIGPEGKVELRVLKGGSLEKLEFCKWEDVVEW